MCALREVEIKLLKTMSSEIAEKAEKKGGASAEGVPVPGTGAEAKPSLLDQTMSAMSLSEKGGASKDRATVPGTETEAKPSLLDQTKSTMSTSDWFRNYMSVAMGLTKPESLLDEVSLEGIARYLSSDKCKKVVTLAGAGISTSAGIPDFRSPGTGVYDRLKEFNIENPSQVFDINYFKEHPDIVYTLRKELFLGDYKPTLCHYFIKLLHTKQKLYRHFTQNIDGLELETGLDPDAIVQAHGTSRKYHCMQCAHAYSKEQIAEVLRDDSVKVPTCRQDGCEGVIRPDIVFFGENLPQRFADRVSDIEECDLLIILGTSLVVQPFASLTSRVAPNTPRLYINLEKSGHESTHPLTVLIFGGGFNFDGEDNVRDVFWQGTCDAGCQALADQLGWGEELKTLVETEHAKIEKKFAPKTSSAKGSNHSVAATFQGKPTPSQASKTLKAPTSGRQYHTSAPVVKARSTNSSAGAYKTQTNNPGKPVESLKAGSNAKPTAKSRSTTMSNRATSTNK